jgi:cyanoexosortase B-associated protein
MTLSRFDASARSPFLKLLTVLFILAIALTGVIPGYVGGHWSWQQVPEINHVQQLKALREQGLQLAGWHVLEQKSVDIGGHKWSAQSMIPAAEAELGLPISSQNPVWLLLRPQTWGKDLPQIDWIDINGAQQWTTDSQRSLSFTVAAAGREQTVKARFLRGWTQKRTDAVLQWYAWFSGGNAAPSRWFWADQWQQFHNRQRFAWVAVSLRIPIRPLGEIDKAEAVAKALGELVQSTLVTTVFQEQSQ